MVMPTIYRERVEVKESIVPKLREAGFGDSHTHLSVLGYALDELLSSARTVAKETYGGSTVCSHPTCNTELESDRIKCPRCGKCFCLDHEDCVYIKCCKEFAFHSLEEDEELDLSVSGVVWRKKDTDKASRPNIHLCDGEQPQLNALLSTTGLSIYDTLQTRQLKYCAASSAFQQSLDAGPVFICMKTRVKVLERDRRRKERKELRAKKTTTEKK